MGLYGMYRKNTHSFSDDDDDDDDDEQHEEESERSSLISLPPIMTNNSSRDEDEIMQQHSHNQQWSSDGNQQQQQLQSSSVIIYHNQHKHFHRNHPKRNNSKQERMNAVKEARDKVIRNWIGAVFVITCLATAFVLVHSDQSNILDNNNNNDNNSNLNSNSYYYSSSNSKSKGNNKNPKIVETMDEDFLEFYREMREQNRQKQQNNNNKYKKYDNNKIKNRNNNKRNKSMNKERMDTKTSFEENAWKKLNSLWDVNSPPVPLPPGETIASRKKKKQDNLEAIKKQHHDQTNKKHFDNNNDDENENDDDEFNLDDEEEDSIDDTSVVVTRRGPGDTGGGGPATVITKTHHSGETLEEHKELHPVTKTSIIDNNATPLHASEALQCKESVINFVINATDGKDECDGLIKAFDKTCSDNDGDDNEETIETDSDEGRYRYKKKKRHRRKLKQRTLWEKLHGTSYYVRLHTLIYQTSRRLERIASYIFGYTIEQPFFFAEDEVYNSWDDARYIVENHLDNTIFQDVIRDMHQQQCILREETRQRKLEEKKNSEDDELEPIPTSTTNKTKTTTTSSTGGGGGAINNLALPIKGGNKVSEKTAADALVIQSGNKFIKAANESIAAKEDAAKSKKSISDTTDAVSAVLNDPSSIEARTCCASILNVYHELCSTDDEEAVSDSRLFFLVFVMAMCGMVKSLIRHFKVLWLPEAAGCIIVGVLSGYALDFFPHHDISFDGNWFLRILVPPIIFEAALSIDKRSFNRHLVPILIYAVAGTLIATFLTAIIVHYGTVALAGWCSPIPYVEALTFGSLISSIDPIAVLSVLSNMGMTDTDTIYVLIFGESLLNDGVAIVLFHTLVHFLDETIIIDREAIIAATVHFFVVAFGSLLIGVASGILSTVYFWIFYGCQTPLVEVLMFFCWALLPYYVCDGIGWSGIVAAVAVGFVMDLNIVGNFPKDDGDMTETSIGSFDSNGETRLKPIEIGRRRIFNRRGHLSTEARAHIGFVTEIIATGMETAIFAYLGFFLFSHRYHWNFFHMIIAILACCVSRAMMIPMLSSVANWITRLQRDRAACPVQQNGPQRKTTNTPAGVIIDKKMQIALWFAGLRGAMSFALVEHIPLYDSFSGEGTRLKPELKAMTSASIMFTVFVLGGYTYYMMQNLGIAPTSRKSTEANSYEVTALVRKGHNSESEEDDNMSQYSESNNIDASQGAVPGKARAFRRQRQHTQQGTVPILTI